MKNSFFASIVFLLIAILFLFISLPGIFSHLFIWKVSILLFLIFLIVGGLFWVIGMWDVMTAKRKLINIFSILLSLFFLFDHVFRDLGPAALK